MLGTLLLSGFRWWFAGALCVCFLLSGCATTPGREKPLAFFVAAEFSPDGKILATATNEGEVALFDTHPLMFRRMLTRESDIRPRPTGVAELVASMYRRLPLAFSTDGTLLTAGDVAGSVVVWEVASGAERFRVPASGSIVDIAFLPDGQSLVAAGPGVVIRSALDGQTTGNLVLPAGSTATAVTASPDGRVLVVGLSTGEIVIFDAASQMPLRTLKGHVAPVTGLAFAPDSASFASNAGGYDLRLWKQDPEGSFAKSAPPPSIAAGADTAITDAQGAAAVLWLFGAISGQALTMGAPPYIGGADSQLSRAARTTPYHCGARVAFSANGRYIASTANLMMCPDCIGTLAPQFLLFVTSLETGTTATAANRGCMVALSPDGRVVATGGAVGTPALLDSATGQPLSDVSPPPRSAQR